ncbi:MAG: RagB/SusD family nutrient uptake outer membrane protein [Muribaculaceae bacterium]|jgi:hypothetical protein|nr:RagB/SusD family nutrient uptake outer membrane protein [Muribaculaceae bacterium]
MKKQILLYGVLALGALMTTSCDDILDKEPLDKFTDTQTYWNNTSNVDNQCNDFYNEFVAYGNGGGAGWFYFKTLSDDQAGNSFTDWDFTNVPASSGYWDFSVIRHANKVIDRVTTSTLTDTQKANYIGIARMIRAWEYFQLVREYGDVPWIDKVVDVNDNDILYGPRTDRDAVMDNVLEDINYASANVTTDGGATEWNRNMANAMKADICLWEGTYRKYRTSADNGKAADAAGATKFLNACVDACNYVIAQGYKLNDNYQANYNSVSLAKNPEMIFYKPYKKDIMSHSLIDYTCSSTQLSGMSKDAFDSYLFLDGKPAATTSYSTDDAGTLDSLNHLNITAQLAVRDKRLNATIDSIVFYPDHTWIRPSVGTGMEMSSSTGYGVKKYDNTSLPLIYRSTTGADYTQAPIFWLSVVYLDLAEAKAELGTITLADLYKTINLLQKRAGLPNLTLTPDADPANNMGVSNLIWEIRRCRRCELMFDNWNRYWDLVRWHQLDKLDSSVHPNILLGANVSKDTSLGTTIAVKNGYLDGSKGMTRKYESKHYFYPVPSGQITLDPQLTQNPGW